MNQQEFEDTSKRYREDLLRMYRSQNFVPKPKPPQSPSLTPMPANVTAGEQYSGTLRVSVTTAKGARPIENATVVVTREEPNGSETLISVQVTGRSGEIDRITIPAPPPSPDQRNPQSLRYDVSVYTEGYYRENSKNVPIFPDIVSMQNFELIPLPAGTDDTQTAGAVTIYNPMPKL